MKKKKARLNASLLKCWIILTTQFPVNKTNLTSGAVCFFKKILTLAIYVVMIKALIQFPKNMHMLFNLIHNISHISYF